MRQPPGVLGLDEGAYERADLLRRYGAGAGGTAAKTSSTLAAVLACAK